jgi:S-DNA-T family DNA segregation ATPase FtsK/SpoIIIE
MKLKFTLARGDRSVDLAAVVDATVTVGELAARIDSSDLQISNPTGAPVTLSIPGQRGSVLPAGATLADAGVRSGSTFSVAVGDEGLEGRAPHAAHALVTVTSGPDLGHEFSLPLGTSYIGREPSCEVRLADPLVSRRHAKIVVGDTIEIVDLGSVNGISVSGSPTARAVLRAGEPIGLGDTALSVKLLRFVTSDASVAQIDFNRSPRLAPRFEGVTFETPEAPTPPQRRRFPIIPLLVPVLMGAVLYAVTRSAVSLVFIGLSPLMMLGNVAESKLFGRRDYKVEVERYRSELLDLESEVEETRERERELRLRENPATAELVDAANRLAPLLWTRRPEHEEFLQLRLGLGRQPSRSTVEVQKNRQASRALTKEAVELARRFADVEGVPVVEKLQDVGALGVAGTREWALPVTRALVAQIATLHSPAEVVLAACASTATSGDWDWLKWLPHTSSPHSPIGDSHLASAAGDAGLLVESLEDLLDRRRAANDDEPLPAVVVLVDDPPAERSRLVALAEGGMKHGVFFVWLASGLDRLPAVCRTFVDTSGVAGTGLAGFVRGGAAVEPLQVEAIDATGAAELGRRLAPMQDAGAPIDDASDLPSSVSLLSLIGTDSAPAVDAVIERWQESNSLLVGPLALPPKRRAGTLRAVIGQATTEPFTVDLRLHGPHALVGGTTGSGKSELLQSWILSLAAAYSPQRVTFLLVDYKGGSAFRECRELPHTVGLVTDLTPHLVQRTLTSLNAELRHREHLLATKRAKDLVELEKAGDPDAPPSLIIVVDEFAALVQEVPEFVDGVVDVGQRGRSLGLHLILATQRPAGVIKENLRANTNLRLALRVADEADSVDVVGSPVAAGFSSDTPGRAVAKTGPGRMVSFQSAYVGGFSTVGAQPAQIDLFELPFGRGREWQLPENVEEGNEPIEPPDITRLVATIREAAVRARIPAPRPPWLEELAPTYDLSLLPSARNDSELVFGVIDDPKRQTQPTTAFMPDRDGNLVVFGTGGSGKSTLMRSLAIAAGFTVRGGPCHVYGIDFGSRGLDMLEQLPHVGSVIDGDDHERIARLLRMVRSMIDERAARYSGVRAGSLPDYRAIANAPTEPRVLVLLDGVAAFRQAYEVGERSRWFDTLLGIASDGRPVGIHVILSADRAGSLPSSLGSSVQRRVVLRLADENEYGLVGLPTDVLSLRSPPGRGLLDGLELQVAVLGGSADVLAQSVAVSDLAASMTKAGIAAATPIARLADEIAIETLPSGVDGLPTLGLESDSLSPIGFSPSGGFLVSGPPGSGRTTALLSIAQALRRWDPAVRMVYLGTSRSPVAGLDLWDAVAGTPEQAAELAARVEADLEVTVSSGHVLALVLEGVPDFVNGSADLPLQELVRRALSLGVLVVAEGETSALVGSYPLHQLVKSQRTGIVLQPDQVDGNSLFRTNFPRAARADFPVGRGLYVSRGVARVVQLPLPN